MSEILLSMGDYLTINDVRRVVEAAKEIGDDDTLVLSMNSHESDKVANIFSVLESHDFECTTKGGHYGKDYYVIARKKHL